ncbi:MAG TPA: hypothetical protein PLH72_04585 [Vicinamibacterales bacterium]|nr:hypothetical protein [Vicinamibacterales bacterium]
MLDIGDWGGHARRDGYKSYHTTMPNGFDLPTSATTKETGHV